MGWPLAACMLLAARPLWRDPVAKQSAGCSVSSPTGPGLDTRVWPHYAAAEAVLAYIVAACAPASAEERVAGRGRRLSDVGRVGGLRAADRVGAADAREPVPGQGPANILWTPSTPSSRSGWRSSRASIWCWCVMGRATRSTKNWFITTPTSTDRRSLGAVARCGEGRGIDPALSESRGLDAWTKTRSHAEPRIPASQL